MNSPKLQEPSRLAMDWEAGHGPLTAAIAMATSAAAVATTGAATGMPATVPLAVGAVGALGHGVIVAMKKGLSRQSQIVRAGTWLAAGCWTSEVIHTNPHTWTHTGWWTAAGSLAALALGAGVGLHQAEIEDEGLDAAQREHQAALVRAELRRADRQLAGEWLMLIRSVTRKKDIEILGLEHRSDRSGIAIEVSLPTSYTLDLFQGCAVALAQGARLPLGCIVRIGPAEVQGHAILDIDLVDTTQQIYEYPTEITSLSITAVPWGVDRNGNIIYVNLREACALILGPPGSGKTTLLDGIIAGLMRCTDVIIWGIDLGKSGSSFRDWIDPWLEDGQQGPAPIDWVATTPEEADAMLAVAEEISDARLPAYRHLMRQNNTRGLLPVSATLPEIIILVDEGVELLGGRGGTDAEVSCRERIKRIMRTDREAGIRTILTATGGNLTAIGDTDVKKHASVRVALTCTDQDNSGIYKLFGQIRGLDGSQLRAKGAGVISALVEGGFDPQPFRTWITRPSLASDVYRATLTWRPAMDGVSAKTGGEIYERRWKSDRVAWLGGLDAGAAPAQAARPGGGVSTLPRSLNLHRLPGTGRDDATAVPDADREAMERDMRESLAALEEIEEPGQQMPAPPPGRLSQTLPQTLNLGRAPERPREPEGTPMWVRAVLTVLREAGPDEWLSHSEIMQRLPEGVWTPQRTTTSTTLKQLADDGRIRRIGGGNQTRYSSQVDGDARP